MKGEIKLARKKTSKDYDIEEKLEYIGLDLENIPKKFMEFEPLEFRVPKSYDEKQYKQYRYVPVNDIQILITPTNRSDDLKMKYKKAQPFFEYLDSEHEENIENYTTFLRMLRQMNVSDIEKIEKEQDNLNKKIPFKVKFEGNYLWQIYYSENTKKYFMLVPTEDTDYSTFFYLIKKQIEDNPNDKIFVPIRNLSYSTKYFKKSEFEDISNYLWLFTKDWPFIYEVYNKKDEMNIIVVGETEVYENIKSQYRIKIKSEKEAKQLYRLLKAMFILQTELPEYYTFKTNINKKGSIDFYHEDDIIEYENMPQWISEECKKGIPKNEMAEEVIEESNIKLEKLKVIAKQQEEEYLAKEKQITTFLECKKSFFGKFKYYFKYGKKKNKEIIEEKIEEEKEVSPKHKNEEFHKKDNYTIEELIEIYKKYEEKENLLKNIVMDINALKLKNKNTKKKIENATAFIKEIDSHKKSIFEFWKYSNKDEVATLTEGETEEVNIIKKISKVFNYKDDFEEFGKTMDKVQRKALSKKETDSVFLTTTNLINIINKVKNNEVSKKDIEQNLKELKEEAEDEEILMENEEFNIFGGVLKESTKISKLANKKHRETLKNKFNILEIDKTTKPLGYKLSLEQIIEQIKQAINKVVVSEDLPIYKAMENEKIIPNYFNIFNINPDDEVKQLLKLEGNKAKLYKFNLIRGINAISYTNCIFYDNQNKTLPIGQDVSSKILIDMSKMKLKLKEKKVFKILEFEDEKDDFSNIKIKTIMLVEYDASIKQKTKKESAT
mgnify:CR=1 FL=1